MAFATCTTLEDAPGRSVLGLPNGGGLQNQTVRYSELT